MSDLERAAKFAFFATMPLVGSLKGEREGVIIKNIHVILGKALGYEDGFSKSEIAEAQGMMNALINEEG